MSQPVLLKNPRLDHESLRFYMKRSLRRGTWAALGTVEKALYRCALWVTKARGKIASSKLSMSILGIITKLVTTAGTRIYTLGLARAHALWNRYTSAGVFEWAPEVKASFARRDYIMYLGVMELRG
jgi:hypothetical protein